MNDTELQKFGESAKFMCSPGANFGEPPRDAFVIQLNEARRVPHPSALRVRVFSPMRHPLAPQESRKWRGGARPACSSGFISPSFGGCRTFRS
jgi:hypothetical protein